MTYRHIQRGWIHVMLLLIAATLVASAWTARPQEPVLAALLIGAVASALSAGMFAHLLIEDRGDHLAVQFGPISLFRKQIPYSVIRSVERGRSTLIDGYGIHWTPGRGWIWNISGQDCVVLGLETGPLRLGTDDAEKLCAFLLWKIGR